MKQLHKYVSNRIQQLAVSSKRENRPKPLFLCVLDLSLTEIRIWMDRPYER